MEKTWTVYMHTNKINNKVYVGITKQKITKRWKNGFGYLEKRPDGKYYQPKIARAIMKYGWNNFEHIIWAEGLSHDEACKTEKLLIGIWDTINNGYNITAGGEGSLGISRCGEENGMYGKHHTDEARKKISDCKKEYYNRMGYDICRPIYQFNFNGVLVREFRAVKEACDEFGFVESVVARSCARATNTAYGYIWAYKDLVDDIDDFVKGALQRLAEGKYNKGQNNSKPVDLYDVNGVYLGRHSTASSLAKYIDMAVSSVSRSCLTQCILKGKYLCKYVE